MKVHLNVSDAAAFIGQNHYDWVTPFERLWKRCDKGFYEEKLQEMSEKSAKINVEKSKVHYDLTVLENDLLEKRVSKRQYTQQKKNLENKIEELGNLEEDLNVKIQAIDLSKGQKIERAFGKETLEQLNKPDLKLDEKKQLIEEKFNELDIGGVEKAELQKTATSFINTTHGTLTEDIGIKMFEDKYNVALDTTQVYFKKRLSVANGCEVYVGGKVDGLCKSDGYIVEVKNRVKGFFNGVREYEKTQIQLYMWILDLNSARLVERYRDKIRVTMIERDNEYIDTILESLVLFFWAFYEKFLQEPSVKCDFLHMTTDEKRHFLRRLYLSDIQQLQQNKLESHAPSCMIDDDLI